MWRRVCCGVSGDYAFGSLRLGTLAERELSDVHQWDAMEDSEGSRRFWIFM